MKTPKEEPAWTETELKYLALVLWKGTGGRETGRKGGGGGVLEAGEDGARKREKLLNIVQYLAIEKMQRGGSQ